MSNGWILEMNVRIHQLAASDDVELVAELIFDRCKVDEMVRRPARCRSCALPACDRPLAAPDADKLALLGSGR